MTASRRRWFIVGIIGLVFLTAIWAKVRLEAGASLSRAEAFERQNHIHLAIAAYRHTVRWYSPGSEPVALAVKRLEALGDELNDSGKPELALEAYRALRSGIFAIRSTYTPYEDRLPRLNRQIAELMADQEMRVLSDADTVDARDTRDARVNYHEKLLSRDNAPHVGWSLLATLGFLAWCISLVRLSQAGFDDETGSIIWAPAAPWFAAVVVTMGAWLAGLMYA